MLAPDVLHFITEEIDTVPHMEALVLMHGSPGSQWTPSQLAARIYVPLDRAAAVLEDLEQHDLAARSSAAEVAFVHSSTRHPADLISRVVHAYQSQLVYVTKLIHARQPDPVREFAREFRIRPKES
jgi:hypothetical protein